MKGQIPASVRQITGLTEEVAKHWTIVERCVAGGNIDDAISLLNAYFGLKTKLEAVEASLRGILQSYFADK